MGALLLLRTGANDKPDRACLRRRYDNSVANFVPTVANFQLGLHLGLQLSGETFGNGNIDMPLGHGPRQPVSCAL